MRTLLLAPTPLLAIFFLLGACSRISLPVPEKAKDFRVLTYSSMTGPSSLGAEIERIFEERCRASNKALVCDLVLVPEDGDSSLVSTYLARPSGFDAILGLESLQVAQLKSKSKVVRSEFFARGPHAFIVDTHVWKDSTKWPKSWKDLSNFPKSVFLQDPRVSSVGIGWIKAIFVHELLNLDDARTLSKKVFPSWSLSYAAFQKEGAPLVWSYQSSEAYHRCEEKSERYRVLPLEEGYPVQEEFVLIPGESLSNEESLFMEVVLSDEVQSQIPLKNWMWPASEKTKLPECFKATSPVKPLLDPAPQNSAAKLSEWTDRWSL